MVNFENWDVFTLPGDNDFFMGSEPSEVDCALFGMLVMIVFNMPSSRHEKYVKGQYVLYLNVNGVNSALIFISQWNRLFCLLGWISRFPYIAIIVAMIARVMAYLYYLDRVNNRLKFNPTACYGIWIGSRISLSHHRGLDRWIDVAMTMTRCRRIVR